MCEPMTWLYFVFVQSVFVFVGQILTAAAARVSEADEATAVVGRCKLNSFEHIARKRLVLANPYP
jgi:hypothetical protein